jgi:hypothetical protein
MGRLGMSYLDGLGLHAPSIEAIIVASDLFKSKEEFTSADAHKLMGDDAVRVSTRSALGRMVLRGVVTARPGFADGHACNIYRAVPRKIIVVDTPKDQSVNWMAKTWVTEPSPTEDCFKWEARDL